MEPINLKLNSIYPFGKWKGIKVSDMLEGVGLGRGDGYEYLRWVQSTCKNISLGKDILKAMNKIGNERKKEWARNYSPRPYTDWNKWENYDDGWLSISPQDMGYDGDGF